MRTRRMVIVYLIGIVTISMFIGMEMLNAEAKDGSFGGGDGTQSNPFIIEDVLDLQAMSSD